MSRRSLLRTLLTAAIGAPTLALITTAQAAPVAGSTTAPANAKTWTSLPGSGLQVHLTDASGRATSAVVSWTTDGTVTATWALPLTVTAPPAYAQQAVTGAAGYGLAVRRAG